MKSRHVFALVASCVATVALAACTTPAAYNATMTFRPIDVPAFASMQIVDKDVVWGVSSTNSLWRSQDAGRAWRRVSLPGLPGSPVSLVLDPLSSRVAWIAASSTTAVAAAPRAAVRLFKTTDGGRTWAMLPEPHGTQGLPLASSADFLNAYDGWLVLQAPHGMGSSPGVLYRTTNGGVTWRPVSRTPIMNVPPEASPAQTLPVAGQIEFTSPENGWLVGGWISTGPRSLYATTDGGANWRLVALPTIPTGATFESVLAAPRSDGDLLTVPIAYQGASGQTCVVLLRSLDRGQSWQPGALLTGGVNVSLLSAHVALALRLGEYDPQHPNRNVPASLWRTDDGGVTWHLMANLSRVLKSQLAGPLVGLSMTFLNVRTGVIWATQYNARGAQRTLWIDETTDGGRTWIHRWPAARH